MPLASDAEMSPPPSGPLAPLPYAGMSAPNVLVPVAEGGAPYPLNHGRIGFDSGVQSATLTASTGSSTVAALATVSTWERWAADLGGEQAVTATFAAARTVDYVGLASYDLDGATVLVQYSPDLSADFTTLATITPGPDGSLMRLFDAVTARRVRLIITRTAPVQLGVWFMGARLDLERPFWGGFTPPTLSRRTGYSNEISAAGQLLGRNINRQGTACSVSLTNLSADWYRANFDPFVQHARRKPFFMLWNPALYPNECIYGTTADDMAPTNIGGRLKVSVSFDMEGYA